MNIDLTAIVAIAEAAGQQILDVYHGSAGQEFVQKSDDSPLTLADQKSNTYIISALQELYPDIPIISEEEKEQPYAARQEWPCCWQIDPLDGTKEFLNRNGEFAVNIALLVQGEAVAGVIHGPILKQTAWAKKGQGAYLKNQDGTVTRMHSGSPEEGQPLRVVASRSHLSPEMETLLKKYGEPETQRTGSSLKFLLIANGDAHFYPRLGPTMEWDTSAGQIIVEEAGGEMLDAETELPLRYNRENMRNGNFMVYGKGVRTFLKG